MEDLLVKIVDKLPIDQFLACNFITGGDQGCFDNLE